MTEQMQHLRLKTQLSIGQLTVRLGIQVLIALGLVWFCSNQLAAQTEPKTNDNDPDVQQFTTEQIEFFENQVRPVLVEHCLECHGDSKEKLRGGLWLTSRKQILDGGDSGPAIVPGKPEESLLIQAVHYEDYEMPPVGKLPAKTIDVLEQWITIGAPDPREPGKTKPVAEINIEASRDYWAFRPVVGDPENESSVPGPLDPAFEEWSRSTIDRWIARAYQDAKLKPVSDADRHQLLRRVHFAITGLPPTPDQIASFTSSPRSIDADLADVVDELLASPRYGERWGRHWLDVARFAESSGGGRSLMFPEAWRFRDYVISAYNEDKPFDQMIMQQIAGDLLPYETQEEKNQNLVAAGFLVLGATNYEQQDKELLRMEVIDEQVDTVGRAFLALTLGCARCHDHKFDPIPTRDYYAMAGIFGNTESLVDGNVSTYVSQSLATDQEQQAYAAYQSQLKKLNQKLKAARNEVAKLGGGSKSGDSTRYVVKSKQLKGIIVDNRDAKLVGKWTDSVVVKQYVDRGYIHDQGQPKGKNRAVFQPKLDMGGQYEVRLAYSSGGSRASNTKVIVDHQDGKETLQINQSKQPPIGNLFVSLGTFRFEADNVAAVTISNEGADGVVIADAVQFLYRADDAKADAPSTDDPSVSKENDPDPAEPKVSHELKLAQARVKALDQQLRKLKSKPPRPIAKAMSVKESREPKDGHVHIRGGVRNLGEVVPRGFLQVVTPTDQWPSIPPTASGRLELAQWIADADNPLTARVYVNRVWRHLFGKGLVETTDNFGQMGTRPSHPELLDSLTSEFVRDGWSTKKLIRKIVLSRVFRLSAQRSDTALAQDPENRMLWRANRRRMDAEVLRDSILFAAGQLDLQAGGLTIRKITQYDLDYEFDTRRRSVYVPAFRNSMLDLFEVFDIANPNMVVGHRNTSTLPTQALFLMNSPWVIDQTASIAKSICQAAEPPRERLELVYLKLLGRVPTDREVELSLGYLDAAKHDSDDQANWQRVVHAIIGSLDFRYIH
ncbi:MAG: DUF1553 domain-containing protein [Planctomycetota bacterium]